MIAHGGEQSRLVGQVAAFADENRKAREAIDSRMQDLAARLTGSIDKLDVRVAAIEHHQSEHNGAKHVIVKGIEWTVLTVIGIFSAVAIWMADRAGNGGPHVHP